MGIEQLTVGIDLGTTRTGVAQIINEEPELIENTRGDALTPSVVRIKDNGEAVVGREAINAMAQYPDQTDREVKRHLGEEEPITVTGKEYLPEQISALILQNIVQEVESRTGRPVSEAVITVPAYFGESERSATKSAGNIAGLEVQRLLPEPSAACLAYGFEKEKLGEGGEELVFVYDLGGGTFDASLVDVDYDINFYETLKTEGISELGGKDWTDRVVDWIAEKAKNESGQDPTEDVGVMERIREEAIEAKHALSSQKDTTIHIPFLLSDYDFEANLTRTQFNELTGDLIEKTRGPIDRLFDSSEYSPDDVDTVLMIGGASRMVQTEDLVSDYFGQEPSTSVSPDKAVTLGAAIQAGIISEGTTVAAADGDDASGVGAADIIDVVPRSLGVELHDGTTRKVIETNEAMPVEERDENYRTVREDQTRVNIPIREGEAEMAEENELIGEVVLGKNQQLPPRDPDEVSLAVEFLFDKDGTLEVEAEDLISGQTVDAVFEGVGRHSETKIAELQNELPGVED